MNVKDFNFRLLHIGINSADFEEGKKNAELMADLFGFPMRETDGSWFLNEQFEIMKMPFRGHNGHIAIATSNAGEARRYLESKGIVFAEETAKYEADGKLKLIYAETEIAGFAFHLTEI